jgi:hypothetical protein
VQPPDWTGTQNWEQPAQSLVCALRVVLHCCHGCVQARAELEQTLQEERANNSAEKQRLQGAAASAEQMAHNHAAQVSRQC